jgi:acyl carrier protein
LNISGKAVQPLLKNLIQETTAVTPSLEKHAILKQIKNTPADQQEALILQHVQQQVIKILGFDSTVRMDPQRALTDLGMDSLMAVELKNKIDADFSTSVPLPYFLEEATVTKLSHRLYLQVSESNGASSLASEQTVEHSDSIHNEMDAEQARKLLENLDQLSADS